MLLLLGQKEGVKGKHLKAIPVLILEKWVQEGREVGAANCVYSKPLARRLESSGLVRPFHSKGSGIVLAALTRIQESRNLTRPRLIEYREKGEYFEVNLPLYEPLLQEYLQEYRKRYPEDYEKLFPEGEPEWEHEPSRPQLPPQALEPEVTRKRADVQSQSLENKILQVVQEYEEAWEERLQDAGNRARALEQENRGLRESSSALGEITDAELKKRIEPLFRSNSQFDTILREASAVFETRLRTVGGCDNTLFGVTLVDRILNKSNPILRFSSDVGEQEGVWMLYRGAMQSIRNPPMHGLKEYPEDKARLFIRVIDSLLLLLTKAEPRRGE
jgi:hypothetical protein